MGMGKWLENWSMRDLEKWSKENPTYDDLKVHCSDNEYLFLINAKLRYANTVLLRIERLRGFLVAGIIIIGVKILGWL